MQTHMRNVYVFIKYKVSVSVETCKFAVLQKNKKM